MTIKQLADTPPWEWPRNAGELFAACLQNPQSSLEDRQIAAELAGDLIVMNDDMAELLLSIVANASEPEELRATAAIALGPALEEADTSDYEDEFEDPVISEPVFEKIRQTLQSVYEDTGAPKFLRRRALEASVRSPQPWHQDAIESSWSSGDSDWILTSMFAMRHARGNHEARILEALKSPDEDLHFEAIMAAGANEIGKAWPHIAGLLSADADRDLLLAAIDAAPMIRPEEAIELLNDLSESIEDEEIEEAIEEALLMARGLLDEGDDDEDDFDDEDIDEEPKAKRPH
ncbi:MAG: hypothetical protein U0R19_32635 [Bryobacteraceae bacterium]